MRSEMCSLSARAGVDALRYRAICCVMQRSACVCVPRCIRGGVTPPLTLFSVVYRGFVITKIAVYNRYVTGLGPTAGGLGRAKAAKPREPAPPGMRQCKPPNIMHASPESERDRNARSIDYKHK
eukprot:1524028-Prymnesium_polylepis.1